MVHALPQSTDNVLGYRCSGTVTTAEIRETHREIRRALDEHGKIRLLLHIADLELPEAKAVVEDFKLTSAYLGDVERYAIVSDAKWHEWMTSVVDLITRGDARHFEADELDRAWDWVLEA
jgi:hypothetical protein